MVVANVHVAGAYVPAKVASFPPQIGGTLPVQVDEAPIQIDVGDAVAVPVIVGFIVTATVEVDVQPFAPVAVTVYVVAADGFALVVCNAGETTLPVKPPSQA